MPTADCRAEWRLAGACPVKNHEFTMAAAGRGLSGSEARALARETGWAGTGWGPAAVQLPPSRTRTVVHILSLSVVSESRLSLSLRLAALQVLLLLNLDSHPALFQTAQAAAAAVVAPAEPITNEQERTITQLHKHNTFAAWTAPRARPISGLPRPDRPCKNRSRSRS